MALTRHEALVHPARRRRRAALTAAVAMDVLAAAGLQSEGGTRGYLVLLLVLAGNLWLCFSGSDRVAVVVGDDGIVSGDAFFPFSRIQSVVTPFRRPGQIRIRLTDGEQLAFSAPPEGHLVALRTSLLQRLAAYRRAAGAAPAPDSFDALASARGAAYRRPSVASALWSLLESPAAAPLDRARAALELARADDGEPADVARMHAAAAAIAHPVVRRLVLAAAGHEPLTPRLEERLLRALRLS